MNRLFALFLSLCIAVISAQGALAQPIPNQTATVATRAALKGGWDVAYRDTRLGLVRGRAYFDPEIDFGTVTFQMPAVGSLTLEAQSMSVKGPLVRVLWAKAGAETDTQFQPIGKKVKAPSRNVRLSLGDGTRTVALNQPPPLDGTLTSELIYYPKTQSFSGLWGQRVDAVTATSGGATRSGDFSHGLQSQGGAVMTGEEMWVTPQPIIKDTFSIRPQFSMGELGPSYPYPFKAGTPPSKYLKTRYVFVYGRNLPHRRGERITIESLDKDVSYYLYGLKSSYENRGPLLADTQMRDAGLERVDTVTQREKPPYEREAGDDFLILEATMKPGVVPGNKGIKINGVKTAWLLRFGDHRATLGFARDLTLDLSQALRAGLPPETQQTDIIYASEQIMLELRTQTEVPIDEFQILLAKNGKLLKFGKSRGLVVHNQKEIGAPKVYRSSPIYLVPAGQENLYPPGTTMISVKPGDTLNASLGGAQVLNLANPLVGAKVIKSPADLLQAIQGPAAPKGRLWYQAVRKAAQCAGLDVRAGDSADDIARLEADSYSDVVISTLWRDVETLLKTRINIGEHAGTIMMRPVFQAMLETAAAAYSAPMDDAAIAGLRRMLETAITQGDAGLSNPRDASGARRLGAPNPPVPAKGEGDG